MSDAQAAVATAKPGWGGGVSPFAVGDKKLGMWLFIVSDALTFSTLIVAYCYVRIANEWPKPFEFYPGIVFASFGFSSKLTTRPSLSICITPNSCASCTLTRSAPIVRSASRWM